MRNKFRMIIGCIIVILVSVMLLVIYVDPYFHFHGPIEGISYRLGNQRYLNDGLARHFDYEAVIIGTSMTENFKPSEVEELFGKKAIKTPFSGAGYKELADNLRRYYTYNDNIDMVIWGMDMASLCEPWDDSKYKDEEYPNYLYDDLLVNDINYLLNKEVILKGVVSDLLYTILGRDSTTLDDYSTFEEESGINAVLGNGPYEIESPSEKEKGIVGEFAHLPRETIEKNFISVIKEHPETEFYIFVPPYSIATWANFWSWGVVSKSLEVEKTAIEMLTDYDNVHVFCFFSEHEIIDNLDNYVDKTHYTADINSEILIRMKNGQNEITKDNIDEYFDALFQYYSTYDYGKIYE